MTRPHDERGTAVPATLGAPPPARPGGHPPAAAQPAAAPQPAAEVPAAPQAATVTAPATGTTSATASTALAAATAAVAPGRSLATGLALPEADRGDPSRPPTRPGGPGTAPDGPGPAGRMARLHIGSHTVSPAALARLGATAPASGLVLGADRRREAVSVRLFRPEPTRVTVVGGVWAAQLVAFRALALGARIVVVTNEPAVWQGFGPAASGRNDRVAVRTDATPPGPYGSEREPLLVVHDVGTAGATEPPALGPWQSQLTVLRRLEPAGVPALQECHLSVLQRLTAAEATVAETALRLPGHGMHFLQVMADDMLALVGEGADRHLWVNQTPVEHALLGTPRR